MEVGHPAGNAPRAAGVGAGMAHDPDRGLALPAGFGGWIGGRNSGRAHEPHQPTLVKGPDTLRREKPRGEVPSANPAQRKQPPTQVATHQSHTRERVSV